MRNARSIVVRNNVAAGQVSRQAANKLPMPIGQQVDAVAGEVLYAGVEQKVITWRDGRQHHVIAGDIGRIWRLTKPVPRQIEQPAAWSIEYRQSGIFATATDTSEKHIHIDAKKIGNRLHRRSPGFFCEAKKDPANAWLRNTGFCGKRKWILVVKLHQRREHLLRSHGLSLYFSYSIFTIVTKNLYTIVMKNVPTARDLVRHLQTKHKLSQQEIADLIDTNQVRISRWSRGGGGKRYDAVLRLRALYDSFEKGKKLPSLVE